MFQARKPDSAGVALATHSLVQKSEQQVAEEAMALVALSHTVVEHQLYAAMLAESAAVGTRVAWFSPRKLMTLTGIDGYGRVRRGLAGLANKLSIERQRVAGDNRALGVNSVYLVFSPEEILARRGGLSAYPNSVENRQGNGVYSRAVKRVIDAGTLSRREAQVALCCVEGMTNAEIGKRLNVSEQTVKFHLRNIFSKLGVKRRAELVSRLLSEGKVHEMSERA